MSRFAQVFGGAERSFVTNARALEDCGAQVYAVSQNPEITKRLAKFQIPNYRIRLLSNNLMANKILFFIISLPAFFLQNLVIFMQQRPDMIYAHSRIDHVFWSKTKFLHRRPVFWKDPSDLAWSFEVEPDSFYGRLHISALNNCDGLYVLSEEYLARLNKSLPESTELPKNLIVAPSGIIPGDYRPKPQKHKHIQIVSVGRLHEKKGFATLIKAVSNLTSFDFKLAIVGEGSEQSQLVSLCENLKLSHAVSFIGSVSSAEDVLNASDIFVSAAEVEPWGLAIAEARLFGKAIVATPTEGALAQLKDGETALITDSFSVDDLAQALEKLIKDQELRKKLGEQAAADVRDIDFNTTMKNKLLPVFENLCEARQ